jgi:hypothetical protein
MLANIMNGLMRGAVQKPVPEAQSVKFCAVTGLHLPHARLMYLMVPHPDLHSPSTPVLLSSKCAGARQVTPGRRSCRSGHRPCLCPSCLVYPFSVIHPYLEASGKSSMQAGRQMQPPVAMAGGSSTAHGLPAAPPLLSCSRNRVAASSVPVRGGESCACLLVGLGSHGANTMTPSPFFPVAPVYVGLKVPAQPRGGGRRSAVHAAHLSWVWPGAADGPSKRACAS